MAAQLRLQDAKEKVLTYGKQVQKVKDEAKTAFDNDEFKSDDQDICQWVTQNYPMLPAVYNEYAAASHAYLAALQQVDPSAAQERQKAQSDSLRLLFADKDAFERTFYIDLPEE
jgi:hypothetical protein